MTVSIFIPQQDASSSYELMQNSLQDRTTNMLEWNFQMDGAISMHSQKMCSLHSWDQIHQLD